MIDTANGTEALKVGKTRAARAEKQVTNAAENDIVLGEAYVAVICVVGVAPLLFHAWNIESIAGKAASAKGSKAKKSDNVESYVYRTPEGFLGVPGMNLAASLAVAAKSRQDPRSPRKSLRDLAVASIIPLDVVAPFEPLTENWDFDDARRVTVQRAGITRIRPAMREGWTLRFRMLINGAEYFQLPVLSDLVTSAGKFVGLCDFRPTYGRFQLTSIAVESEA